MVKKPCASKKIFKGSIKMKCKICIKNHVFYEIDKKWIHKERNLFQELQQGFEDIEKYHKGEIDLRATMLSSSEVEQLTVNQRGAGSIPA